jgi:dipeptidyl aminopeptidase/acylaminoacyl peptidase
LLSLLKAFAKAGYLVTCLDGPGSRGRGRFYREATKNWVHETAEIVAARVVSLLSDGITRVGIVAGSLGALPVLHFIRKENVSAAVLFSPVYHPKLPALIDWQHLFGATEELLGPEQLASDVRTPVLVLHGLRDEVSPAGQSSRFVSYLGANIPCEYTTFPDEGHIFRSPENWKTSLRLASAFLQRYMDGPLC